ncbi:uncharacterized protein BO87DRAFT_214016 [Aspergillus neoniger CBS 115656]|uniref:Uncharacterized protein n=1 Tax=Aspergillus neoniger (strain CBS 115656) TaxID=1448310 RepID=A0A318Y2K8_ASPNB|nr:hypothetical protein BO87DRAFT_214016 [Aspergillus neoniger CBS 115656]PYH28561.1 hypothetical protein BO87DRAFT_214016 [Aspergillus neoniger CBS 115656]
MPGRLDPRTFPHCYGGLPEYMPTIGVHDRAENFLLRFMIVSDRPIISHRKVSVQRSWCWCLLIWHPTDGFGRVDTYDSSSRQRR